MTKNEQALLRALSTFTYAEMTTFCLRIKDFSAIYIDAEDMAATLRAIALSDFEE